MQQQSPLKNSHGCELLLACQVGASLQTSERLEVMLQEILKTAAISLGFQHVGLVLLPHGKPPVYWQEGKPEEAKNAAACSSNLDHFLNLFNNKSKTKSRKMLEPLRPVIATTLPVVLRTGDPVSIMEIGIFRTDRSSAQYMLVKAVSIARHIADTLQESFFQRQKDPHLRKMAVWLEMINTIGSTLDIREVLHVVAQLTADFFSAKSCIYLLNEEENTLIPAVGVGSYDPDLKKKFKALRGTKPFPAITRVLETQQPVIVTPTNRNRFLSPEIIKDFDYSWMVLVPILSKDKIIGIMQVDRPRETSGFNQEETEIIFAIARATAIAMENAQLIEVLGQKEQLLHQLVDKLITAQEDERKRLAADLHDGIIQSLIAVWYRIQRITSTTKLQDDECHSELNETSRLLNEQILEIRRMLYDLRPLILDNYGLFPAVESYVQKLQEKNSISIELSIKGSDENLNSRLEITLFRILQEALTNVIKHANATSASVALTAEADIISLKVDDNGTGLNTSLLSTVNYQERLGLAGMHERALLLNGTCNIESWPGKGTHIFVTLPIPEQVEE